jgi:succinoglycan biosynthesis transport protein ExoP
MIFRKSEQAVSMSMRRLNAHTPGLFRAVPLATALAAGLIAYLVTLFIPKVYRSEATLYFPMAGDVTQGALGTLANLTRPGSVMERGGAVSLFGGMLVSPQVATGPQTAIAVLASARCRERVCDRLQLPARWGLPRPKALKKLQDSVTFGVDKNGLLAMQAEDRDPNLAAEILNSYITTLGELAKELSLNVSYRNRIFLESRLNRSRLRLAEIERKMLLSMETDPNPELLASTGKAGEAVIELESERNRARISLEAVEAQLEWQQNVIKSLENGAQLPSNSSIARAERNRVRELESEFAIVKVQYGPDNPRYRTTEGALKAAREQLRLEMERVARAVAKGVAPEVIGLWSQRASLEAQIEGLDRALRQVSQRLSSVPRKQLERERLQREMRFTADMVGILEIETERARIAETRDATAYQVVDTPQPPEEPFWPRKLFTSALAAVAGFLLGLAFLTYLALRSTSDEGAKAA